MKKSTKIIKYIFLFLTASVLLVAIAGMYKFNYLANKEGYDVDGNKEIENTNTERNLKEIKEKKNINVEINNSSDKKEFLVEISRQMKDCFAGSARQCLQIKKEGEGWKIFYDQIDGLDYIDGDYYLLKIEEKKINSNNKDLPENTWVLKEIIKHYPAKKEIKKEVGENIDKVEKRCGYLVNPSPGNWWLNDADDSWTIANQGGYRVNDSSINNIPNISSSKDYVKTNSGYGYACACLDIIVDKKNKKVLKILGGENIDMEKCLNDKKLKGWN